MRRKVVKNLKGASGITLIALVITIIVLLILAGVSIAMLTGDNGILKQANKAKVETRGASVQEVRDLWFIEKKLNAAKSLDEVLQGLRDQDLLTDEEVAEVKETGQVTIGSRTIEFGGGNVELVAKIKNNQEDGSYTIGIGFKQYQVDTDYTKITGELKLKYVESKSEEEKEKLFIELYNIESYEKFENIEDIFQYEYESGLTTKICTTLDELAIEWNCNSVEELIAFSVNSDIEFWKQKLEISDTDIISGTIIDPEGMSEFITTEDIIVSNFSGKRII